MKKINMQFEKNYNCRVIIDEGILSDIAGYLIPVLPEREAVLITNPLVRRLYGDKLVCDLSDKGIAINIIEVPDGEKNKNLSEAQKIYDQLLELKASRSTAIITLGGGVIGDLGGFVASTFMRGIPLIQIPTTLLAQIDSSIGGKMAVDHPRAKNMVGSFYPPMAVFVDPVTLKSLPVADLKNGLAEAIKIAIIAAPSFFGWLDKNMDDLLKKNQEKLGMLIEEAIRLKSEIVMKDPWEKKERHYLNLGHSIGHALETAIGYGSITHGQAVALGIILETQVAFGRNRCSKQEKIKIEHIIKKLQLPIKLEDLSGKMQLNPEKCWQAILLDKKNKNGIIRFVLPEKVGKVDLVQPILKEDVFYAFDFIREEKEE